MTKDSNDSKQTQVEERLSRLELLVERFAETGTLGNTLGQGLEVVSDHMGKVTSRLDLIAAQLQPLRRLEGAPVQLSEPHQAVLDHLLSALDRPDFTRVRALPVDDKPVPFIGDIQDAVLVSAGAGVPANLPVRST